MHHHASATGSSRSSHRFGRLSLSLPLPSIVCLLVPFLPSASFSPPLLSLDLSCVTNTHIETRLTGALALTRCSDYDEGSESTDRLTFTRNPAANVHHSFRSIIIKSITLTSSDRLDARRRSPSVFPPVLQERRQQQQS